LVCDYPEDLKFPTRKARKYSGCRGYSPAAQINKKGYGLGLYYEKTMIEAHGGYISVISELNKGSRFNVYLPWNNPYLNNELHGKIKRKNIASRG